MQARAQALGVPLRYYQWDDWWMFQKDDLPGMVYWWPTPESIPTGMTDWLGTPTSLYNPGYSAQNVYLLSGKYKWVTSGDLALPVDPAYYAAIFKNASAARMTQFEQDFLCSYSWVTDLTVRDVTTGAAWLRAMDDAAVAAGVSLQLCMMTPLHALASTQMRAATNGRGTSDNTHSVPADVLKMGHSGLLLRGLGMYVSRDNVYTSLEEPGCGVAGCTSADAVLQNVAAVLGGGPYGVSDGTFRKPPPRTKSPAPKKQTLTLHPKTHLSKKTLPKQASTTSTPASLRARAAPTACCCAPTRLWPPPTPRYWRRLRRRRRRYSCGTRQAR